MPSERTKKTKWALSALVVAIAAVIAYVKIANLSHLPTSTIRINNQTLKIKIATSSQDKTRGLCCRDSLPADQGMLFVYDTPGLHAFWMKDTRIPLDIIWINSNKEVVHIAHSVQPDSYPQSFVSDEPAQ